jgi:D-sedoheptulose 7-phosphate isomerase
LDKKLRNRLLEIFKESIRLKESFLKANMEVLEEAIRTLASVLGQGNKILLFGNGGSAADAQHIAAEFVNRYIMDRPPLPAIALTTDSSVLTAISNDFATKKFEKDKGPGQQGDAAVGINAFGSYPTSSEVERAGQRGLIPIGIGGPTESPMKEVCRYYVPVEGAATPRIQEVHITIGHAIVEVVDHILFGTGKEK